MTDPRKDGDPGPSQAPGVAFTIHPIGLMRAAPRKRVRIPKYFRPGWRGTLEVFHPYIPGLQGLYGGMDLWVLIYQAHSGLGSANAWKAGDGLRGVFSTTSAARPNPIEFLRVRVVDLDLERGLIHVEGLDMDGVAPILDIRPAIPPLHRLSRGAADGLA